MHKLVRFAVRCRSRKLMLVSWLGIMLAGLFFCTATSLAQESSNSPARLAVPPELLGGPEQWTSPEGLTSALQVMFLMTVISLAPALLMMTTCFIRVLVVLGLLRQALGTQQLPPNQVLTSLALFITLAVMTPVWTKTYEQAIVPYTNHQINVNQAFERGVGPIRRFMSLQIERCGNSDDVWLFMRYTSVDKQPETYDDVPLSALLPAFMLSELKTAFLIGFQIYLPFLIIDMVVSSVLIAMGMMMLPPVLISLPFKLLLFVMIDGWHLIVGMLMDSFQAFT